jgi:hypothetical protein
LAGPTKKLPGSFLVEPRCSLRGGFTRNGIKFPSGVLLDRGEIASSRKDAPRNDRIKEFPAMLGMTGAVLHFRLAQRGGLYF